MSIPKSSSPANFNINNDNTREETTPRNTLSNIYNYNYSPPPSDELRQQQQALQINNTPEYIISSPQLFLSIKHINSPGTNSPSYSPISNSSYSPYYFHHSTTTSTSPFPIRCQCLLCVEASTSGGDDSNSSSNYCQTGEFSDYSDHGNNNNYYNHRRYNESMDDNYNYNSDNENNYQEEEKNEEKEKISSSLYKSQESTLLVYHHHDINDRSSSLRAFSPINMGGIGPVNIYESPMAANGNLSSSSSPSSYKQQQQQHLSSTASSHPLVREVKYNNRFFNSFYNRNGKEEEGEISHSVNINGSGVVNKIYNDNKCEDEDECDMMLKSPSKRLRFSN